MPTNIRFNRRKRQRGFEIVSSYKGKNINLPQRQTIGAVGYDFEAAEDIVIPSIWKQAINWIKHNILNLPIENADIKPIAVPTGIKSYFPKDEVLYLFNRSSNPFKRGLVLANSTGVIDSDYYNNSENEGHIMFMFYNFGLTDIHIKKGERIGQGVFQKILLADNDNPNNKKRTTSGSTGIN